VDLPSEGVARVEMRRERVRSVEGIEVYREYPGDITGLPEPSPGVIYVVSRMVLDAARRADLVAPGTPERDAEGRIVACLDVVTS
jgi:hypothetical protein